MEETLIEIFFDDSKERFYTSIDSIDSLYGLGKAYKNRVYLEPEEVMYLLDKKKVFVRYNNNEIQNIEEFIEMFSDLLSIKVFLVLRDLRDRGYYITLNDDKTIIIHAKGEKNNPIYLCLPILEHEIIEWKSIIDYLYKAKNIGTKLLLGFVDDEFDIVYYELSEVRL